MARYLSLCIEIAHPTEPYMQEPRECYLLPSDLAYMQQAAIVDAARMRSLRSCSTKPPKAPPILVIAVSFWHSSGSIPYKRLPGMIQPLTAYAAKPDRLVCIVALVL